MLRRSEIAYVIATVNTDIHEIAIYRSQGSRINLHYPTLEDRDSIFEQLSAALLDNQ